MRQGEKDVVKGAGVLRRALSSRAERFAPVLRELCRSFHHWEGSNYSRISWRSMQVCPRNSLRSCLRLKDHPGDDGQTEGQFPKHWCRLRNFERTDGMERTKNGELILCVIARVMVGPIVCRRLVGMGSSEPVVGQLHVKSLGTSLISGCWNPPG